MKFCNSEQARKLRATNRVRKIHIYCNHDLKVSQWYIQNDTTATKYELTPKKSTVIQKVHLHWLNLTKSYKNSMRLQRSEKTMSAEGNWPNSLNKTSMLLQLRVCCKWRILSATIMQSTRCFHQLFGWKNCCPLDKPRDNHGCAYFKMSAYVITKRSITPTFKNQYKCNWMATKTNY